MALKSQINGWKRIRKRIIGKENPNISIIYNKGTLYLEIFKDHLNFSENVNVIITDSRLKTWESSLGKSIHVEYAENIKEAEEFAKKYMENN